MSGDGPRLSRRAVIPAFLCAALSSSPARAQSSSDSGPPLLRTAASQFTEIRPLIEAPPLKLERIDGKTVALDEFRGKVVLMNFWATWCPPCRRELPTLERLERIVGLRDLEIIAVSIDRTSKPAIAAFLKSMNITRLRPFVDPEGRVARRVGEEPSSPFVLYGMPISYVIDRHGRVVGYITGEVEWTSEDGLALMKYIMDA